MHEYEKQLAEKIEDAKIKKAPNVMVLLTEQQYIECFIEYRLPIRKRRQDRPLTWVNDAELDKLTAQILADAGHPKKCKAVWFLSGSANLTDCMSGLLRINL